MKINGVNNGYIDRVQPVKSKGAVNHLSDDNKNQSKNQNNSKQDKKKNNEFNQILKSKFDTYA